MPVLKDFIDRYYPTVFTAAARLTGSSDQEVLIILTENILVKLWQERQLFDQSSRPGCFYTGSCSMKSFPISKQAAMKNDYASFRISC
jgi:hypothetical protein